VSRKGPASLSIVQQAMGIRSLWPAPAPKLKRAQLVWIGRLQPTPVSPIYAVRLRYDGSYPRVHVLDPKLDSGHQGRLPHVYSGDELCLYTPGEWKSSMPLATTVIPWIAEWLLYYELWLATDGWSGGGHVFAPPERDQRAA
jgi:hypothetical protein